MGNNEEWATQVQEAAARAGERVWPLPLPDDYRRMRPALERMLRGASLRVTRPRVAVLAAVGGIAERCSDSVGCGVGEGPTHGEAVHSGAQTALSASPSVAASSFQ